MQMNVVSESICVTYLQGSLSFMEDSGLSQPLIPSKPLAPAAEVRNII